jgi:hypothetical protein
MGNLGFGYARDGNLLGKAMQNWLHSKIGYPALVLRYIETNGALFLRAGLAVDMDTEGEYLLQAYSDILYYTAAGPSSWGGGFDVFFSPAGFIDAELLFGLKVPFRLPTTLAEILTDQLSPLAALSLSFEVFRIWRITVGMAVFPVTDDESFVEKSYTFIPQFWHIVTYGEAAPPLRNLSLP